MELLNVKGIALLLNYLCILHAPKISQSLSILFKMFYKCFIICQSCII